MLFESPIPAREVLPPPLEVSLRDLEQISDALVTPGLSERWNYPIEQTHTSGDWIKATRVAVTDGDRPEVLRITRELGPDTVRGTWSYNVSIGGKREEFLWNNGATYNGEVDYRQDGHKVSTAIPQVAARILDVVNHAQPFNAETHSIFTFNHFLGGRLIEKTVVIDHESRAHVEAGIAQHRGYYIGPLPFRL